MIALFLQACTTTDNLYQGVHGLRIRIAHRIFNKALIHKYIYICIHICIYILVVLLHWHEDMDIEYNGPKTMDGSSYSQAITADFQDWLLSHTAAATPGNTEQLDWALPLWTSLTSGETFWRATPLQVLTHSPSFKQLRFLLKCASPESVPSCLPLACSPFTGFNVLSQHSRLASLPQFITYLRE